MTSEIDVATYKEVLRKLPLLSTYFSRSWERSTSADEHAILYINAVNL
jgi:hypothetical protein